MLIESAVRIVRLVDVEKREFLSVRHLEAEVVIDGPLCRSDLRITFANDLDRTIEGDLVFPLPPFSALCELSVKVGKRLIEGKVRPRERAQAEYRRAVQAGKTAALGESEGEDLGRLRIAPIEIGEDVEVTIGLLHTLTPISEGHRLLLPLTYMPRYVEDEAGLKPTERAAIERPRPLTAAARANVKVSIRKNGVPVKVRCPTHSAQIDDRGGLLEVGVRGVALDRDLHLEICDRNSGEKPTVWVRHDPSAGPDKQGPTTAVALLPPPFADEGATIARSVILLVDRSGSMSGAPMDSAIRAVKGCLRALGPADQFNVVAFSDSLYALAPRALQFSDVSLKLADEHASSLSATGGTEAGAALQAVLDDKISDKKSSVEFFSKEAKAQEDRHRLRIVVMMTDGDVGSAENVLRQAKDRLIDTRLFVIGIGESVNHAMLAQLAELGSGTYTPVSTNEDLERALHKLKNAIDAPLLTGVTVQLEAGGERLQPQKLEPSGRLDLFAGQPLLVAFRGEVPRGAVLHVSAQSTDGEDVTFNVPVVIDEAASAVDAETASVLWALLRNRRLTYRFDSADDATLEALGVAFGLVNRKVAIVGVHNEQRTTDAPETVAVSLPMPRNLNQGAMRSTTTGGLPPPPAPARPMVMAAARPSPSMAAPVPSSPMAPPPAMQPMTMSAPEMELDESEEEAVAAMTESPAPEVMARAAPSPAKKMAKKPAAPKVRGGGGIISRVKNLFGAGDSDGAQRADDEDDAVDSKVALSPPPAPPPPPTSAPPPVMQSAPSKAGPGLARPTAPREEAKREQSYHFTDDEAGLRALLLSQRADGLFGGDGDLGATVAAIAALVGRGHTARTGSFRAELRRTVTALRALLPKASGDEKTLCALGLALLLMPNGEAAPAELPTELAQILDGKSASDGAALAAAVRAAIAKAPAAVKTSSLAAAIFSAFLK